MIKVKIDPKKELFRWGPIPGNLVCFYDFVMADFGPLQEKFPEAIWPDAILLVKNKRMLWIEDFNSLNKSGSKTFNKYMLSKEIRQKLYYEWKETVNKRFEYYKRIEPIFLSGLSKSGLLVRWQEYIKLSIDFWTISSLPEIANYGSLPILEKKLKKHIKNKEELMSAMEILTIPEKLSFYLKEEIELLKTNDIRKHYKNYFWLKNSYGGVQLLNESYFISRKKELKPDLEQKSLAKIEQTKQKKIDLQKRYDLSVEIMETAKAITAGIEWQDERKEYIFKNLSYLEYFLIEISKRYGYSLDELRCSWEIEDIIRGEDFHEILKNRVKNGAGVYCKNKAEFFTNEQFQVLWKEYLHEKIEINVKEFSGIIACKGKGKKVIGRVKVLLDPHNFEKVKKGDILVAPRTSPEYVFVMKKVGAVITDTGGLTSHAAIVSRELNVPCIIGTKIATQVLKDGDLVEVDADSGMVKILNK